MQIPLYHLIAEIKKRDEPLTWNDATRATFHTCRAALAATAELAHPKPDVPHRLSTDASLTAVSTVL